MARIAYHDADAEAFAATRHLTDEGVTDWRAAVTRHLDPRPGMRLLDLGAGTGSWAHAFTTWFPGVEVVAVEPSAAMRARCAFTPLVAGDATSIPLADRSLDGVWLSTVVHHVPDLAAAARELRRVLRPGAPVLIRSAFAGRHEAITLFRFFPEAIRVLDSYPGIADVEAAFVGAGFTTVAVEPVPQVTAPSLREAAAGLRREAHTPLQLITDDEYAAGLERLREAARVEAGPVIDALDLLVLRRDGG
ncbi:methyltransferase domain-containing protein [Micromonospora sp. WMMA1998]|uniref:class I SAM-dependent methyltransferase n=1 Tax=Micromonospora sp. WMMA1998 TaxID=3015167 RepID=UPI00248BD93B|nr:methyltransferase domain-containing protein [Micromonospora sp. WMMA1998]WBC15851.1 methyltransferase domain-containing protein [Micromonospora sp. WMMA1998]